MVEAIGKPSSPVTIWLTYGFVLQAVALYSRRWVEIHQSPPPIRPLGRDEIPCYSLTPCCIDKHI